MINALRSHKRVQTALWVGLGLIVGSSAVLAAGLDPETQRFLFEKKWAEAVLNLKREERFNPSSIVRQELGRALFYSGRREEAIGALQRAIEHSSGAEKELIKKRAQIVSRQFFTQDTFLLYQEGLHLLEAKKLTSARERFLEALKHEPDNVEILVRSAQCQLLVNDFDLASERLRLARKLNPDDPEIRLWLGRALFFRGEMTASIEELRSAMTAMPENEEAVLWASEVWDSLGQGSVGLAALDRHVQQFPLHLRALLALAEHRMANAKNTVESLWVVRKDLQLAISRLKDHLEEKNTYPSDSLHLDLRDASELKQGIDVLTQKVDQRISEVSSRETSSE